MFLNPKKIVTFFLITKARITQNIKPSPSSFIMYKISCSQLNLLHTGTYTELKHCGLSLWKYSSLHFQWVSEAPFLRLKLLSRQVNYSPPSSTEVGNTWSCTSTPSWVFMAWCLADSDKFTTKSHADYLLSLKPTSPFVVLQWSFPWGRCSIYLPVTECLRAVKANCSRFVLILLLCQQLWFCRSNCRVIYE